MFDLPVLVPGRPPSDKNDSKSIADLAWEFAQWFKHIPGDASSDVAALRHVVRGAHPDALRYCSAFGASLEDFTYSVGFHLDRQNRWIWG